MNNIIIYYYIIYYYTILTISLSPIPSYTNLLNVTMSLCHHVIFSMENVACVSHFYYLCIVNANNPIWK